MMERPHAPASTAAADVRRWMAAAGTARDDLLLLERCRTGAEPAWARTVETVLARNEATSLRQLAVSGADLISAGVGPGPALGDMLERLLGLVLEDPRQNTREALLDAVRQWK
jgi:hypothetical protein